MAKLVYYIGIVFSFLIFLVLCNGSDFEELFKWKQIEYETTGTNMPSDLDSDIIFPDAKSITGNSYIPYNNVPMGICSYDQLLIITVPRRRPGIPSTLNYVSKTDAGLESSPRLRPFPNAEINSFESQSSSMQRKLVSVYRPRADSCNRLWFTDTGMLEYPGNRTQVKRPAIWVIDLITQEIVYVHEVPRSIVEEGRGMASIAVDVSSSSCDNAMAYIPDLVHNALYVYSLKEKRMWTFRHNYFHFDPLGGDLSIAGQNFRWNDGIFSITLGNRSADGFRNAYFHALASTSEFTVSTRTLRNESYSTRSYHFQDFKHLGNRGSKRQSTMHAYDSRTKVIFYAEIAQSGIGCWNTDTPFNNKNNAIIQKNSKTMIYPSDIMVDQEGVVWAITNSMPIFIYSQLDVNAFNFRVWRQSAAEAIKGTVCAG